MTAPTLNDGQQWLVDQWNDGQSATQLAVATGRTRNAILGEIHRLRCKGVPLVGRQSAGRRLSREPPPPRLAKPKPQPRRRVEISAPFDPAIAVRVEDARRAQCRWPFGDPQEDAFRYCGRAKFEGHPYCEAHCADAYQPRKQRHEEAA